jgi:hypothetical protein
MHGTNVRIDDILFYAVLLWFDTLMMVPCGTKRVGIFSVILLYKYVRNNFVDFIGLVS